MDRDRYLRHARVEGLDQEALRAMRVVVVGAGAVGNEVVKNLTLLGVGTVEVFDFDRVEIHNLTRSVFLREADVGTPKAAAVVARASEVDPGVRLSATDGDFWRTLSLGSLARADVAICCVDNFEARLRLSQLCLLAGVDLVNAAIDGRFVTVETFPFAAERLPACYECHLPASAYERVAERYSCGWLRRALHAERVVATTAITASVGGALAVQSALRIGEKGARPSRRVLIDTRTGASTLSTLGRNRECAGCGEFVRRPVRVPGRGGWRAVVETTLPGTRAVRLADPIVFAYRCRACGATADADRYVGHRADEFDDRIMRCGQCGEFSAEVDIRSETTVDVLTKRFGDGAIPAKFLLAGSGEDVLCIDLEE